MKIPRDLKPGDRLYYSKTEYVTAAHNQSLYGDGIGCNSIWIWATIPDGSWTAYDINTGHEVDRATPPIVRIVRVTSKKPKPKPKKDKDAWAVIYWCSSRENAREVKDYLDHQCPKAQGSCIRRIAKRPERGV